MCRYLKYIALIVSLTFSLACQADKNTDFKPDPELRKVLVEAIGSSDSFENRFDAEVWLVDMSGRMEKYVKDPEERLKILRHVHYEAKRANLEPELVLSVIHVESLFERYAISSVGAQGLMQIMPFWLDEIGRPEDNLFDIRTNLRFGCTILKHYLKKEKGDLTLALARYNGSRGKFKYPKKVYRAWKKYWYAQ